MHIFHSCENIKTCIFTANLYFHSSENTRFDIFTGEKPYFFLFSQYDLREATLYGISVSFLRETTIGVSYFYGVRVAYKLNKRKSFL